MKKFDPNVQGTREQMEKALACQNTEELMQLAKDEGFDMTKEEAEKYFDQLSEIELSPEELKQAAGGKAAHLIKPHTGRSNRGW